ncbi:MAG: 5-deoxy-glucuronate isomerase [Acidobacteria bacterium]|nr:MAG: 5-deoxy-glucuronate isomerase [Acidobacteriota bacterium]
MKTRRDDSIHLRSRRVPPGRSAPTIAVTPARARWEFISFTVRTLAKGDTWQAKTARQEMCVVLLSGACRVEWTTRDGGAGRGTLGPRAPRGSKVILTATAPTEIAECRAPSTVDRAAALVGPGDCGFEIRGGGNATRQIIDILPPRFPADRLMICEVLTPAGNWSSYPPHKHDTDRPPTEADLEEIYYFRFRHPQGYGFHRVYTADGRRDQTMLVRDGDLVIVREGYHPFVTAYGHDAYYLNVLAGTRRSMAASDDPQYAEFRHSWPARDPRLPLIPHPGGDAA